MPDLKLGRRRGHGSDDRADRGLELVRELEHIGPALGSGARLCLFLLRLRLFDPQEIVLEDLGGTRVVANLVAALGIGNVDRLVAVGEIEQRLVDAVDRTGDVDH